MKRMREIENLDRPREKIARKGVFALSDQELFAAIIGKGTRDHDVREISSRLARQMQNGGMLSYEELLSIEGIGPTKASVLVASFELARRYGIRPDDIPVKITHPEDILPLVADIRNRMQELFLCITLNGAGEVIQKRIITMGILNHSLVHPREVFADAITDRAASIICVHNHPSGTLTPSEQDKRVTAQLAEAGKILGIDLLDHLVVTKSGYLSLREEGFLV
ncbi:MAG: DNA repair protein RadC [Methanospirillaceae archaeon]|nr:DNA repair protein RadC [Methanospirillaceae archaeon]